MSTRQHIECGSGKAKVAPSFATKSGILRGIVNLQAIADTLPPGYTIGITLAKSGASATMWDADGKYYEPNFSDSIDLQLTELLRMAHSR